jgi:hypothetical protein
MAGIVDSRLAATALACCLAGPASAAQTPASPVFRAEADLVTIELQVTARKGGALSLLPSERFEVQIEGRKRRLLFATLLHEDDGAVVRGLSAPRLDTAVGAPCIFRNLRLRDVPHAHYRIGLDTTDADRRRVGRVRIKTTDKDLLVARWAWRSRSSASGKPR